MATLIVTLLLASSGTSRVCRPPVLPQTLLSGVLTSSSNGGGVSLHWTTLTNGQWTALTNGQWTGMAN